MKEVNSGPEVPSRGAVNVKGPANSGKGPGRSQHLYLLFLLASILFTGIVAWDVIHGRKFTAPIPIPAIENDSEASYRAFLPESGNPLFEILADTPDNPRQSKTRVFENDAELGPAHSIHEKIRSVGSGQFSHWGTTLYFSASDNSDPRTNGRQYRALMSSSLPAWMLTFPLLCLVVSLYLNRRIISQLSMMARRKIEAYLIPSLPGKKIRWRWGVLAGIAMALLSLFPQIDLWVTRATLWEGSYASVCYDEEMYASYIQGLIMGRPRRHLPLEIPDTAKASHETPLSIQLVPAYFAVFLARVFRLRTAGVFILLTPLMAYLSTLILFYLIASVTRDEALAAVSALAALIFGTLAARHSVAVGWLGGSWYGSFLFLRRYIHAVSFPIFLGFITLIWQGIVCQGRKAWLAAIAASALFALLVFSYFFLWTAALAWLACFSLLWLIARRREWSLFAKRLIPSALIGVPALLVFAFLFFQRDPEIDKTHALEFVRVPDLNRAPVWIACAAIVLLLVGIKQRRIDWREPRVLLALSFALMPFAVFNQQIITGRSLQPEHYEMYSANYLSLVALILAGLILWQGRAEFAARRVPRLLLAGLLPIVIAWGAIEMYAITTTMRQRNLERDRFAPVTRRLAQLAAEHHLTTNEREVVFSPDVLVVAENVATLAPQVPLMTTNLPLAGGLSGKDWRERYFQNLYYAGVTPNELTNTLTSGEMVATMSLFGYERYNPGFTRDFRKITSNEIEERVREYAKYVASFNNDRALHPKLSYVVLLTAATFDFSNIDSWYRHDLGQRIGPYTLYQLQVLEP
jgi:hypothetical protein